MNALASIAAPSPVAAPIVGAPVVALAERALIVRLNISLWTAGKVDKVISAEVAEAKKAQSGTTRVSKKLLSPEALEKVRAVYTAATADFKASSAAWGENKDRIISVRGFAALKAKMAEHETVFNHEVSGFITDYPALMALAPSILGGAYNASDYPAVNDLREKFRFRFTAHKVPEANDIRLNLDSAQVADIRASITAETADAFRAATKETYARIAEACRHMSEKLRGYEPSKGKGDETKGVFHKTLVSNMAELADALPSLNLADDPALDAIAKRIKSDLCEETADVLRQSARVRKSVADAADDILSAVSAYI